MGHCATCDAYEAAVQAGEQPREPCGDYVMSDGFRAWLVEQMRREVFGDTQMAILSQKQGQDKEDGPGAGARDGGDGGRARGQERVGADA